MASAEIQIHPTGWETSPESERHPLSLIGHIMPKIYVLIAEVFELPSDVDTEAITQNMQAGLEFALSQFPVLTGALEMDSDTGQMFLVRKRSSTLSLHIKHFPGEGVFPSYQELAQKDFPASMIAGDKLLPESVTSKQLHSPLGDNSEDGIRVATVQLNFIRGGLVVGVAVHHAVSDGPGCDGFLATWAENSAAIAKGEPLIPTKHNFSIHGSPLTVEKPTPESMAELNSRFPVVRDAGGPMAPPPPGFIMPSLIPQMWHFPRTKVESLKAQVAGAITDGWVSTYDVIMAILWGSITRAKLAMLQPDMESKVTLINAVDTRKVWDPPLPERFLGVGAVPARCDPLTIREVIAPENLAKLATTVRASINSITPHHLTGLLHWVAGHKDRRWLETNVNSFLGMDLAGSSWQAMTAYEKHDFGFGLPKALRWPSPQFDGFVFLYPSRAAAKPAEADEKIELCVCLEKSCQETLMKDKTLLAYARPRGI